MRAKRICVTAELLRAAMRLPEAAVIADTRRTDRYGEIEMLVVSDEFEDVKEGDILPLTRPRITAIQMPCGCHEYAWSFGD